MNEVSKIHVSSIRWICIYIYSSINFHSPFRIYYLGARIIITPERMRVSRSRKIEIINEYWWNTLTIIKIKNSGKAVLRSMSSQIKCANHRKFVRESSRMTISQSKLKVITAFKQTNKWKALIPLLLFILWKPDSKVCKIISFYHI